MSPEENKDSSSNTDPSITALLNAADNTQEGMNHAFNLVYAELRVIARRVLSGSGTATLSPTVLVHEAYVKLIGSEALNVSGRRHFFALCARTMRQIVIDYARRRLSKKRGGGRPKARLTDEGVLDISRPETLVAMEDALVWLETRDPRLVELIHFRVYAGMQLAEISPLVAVSVRQLQRDWKRAQIWMTEALLDKE